MTTLASTLFRQLGALSDGIDVGRTFGFSSGEMLDYVYENRASGWGPLGRWIDRIYLDSIGWRGIRERRARSFAATSRKRSPCSSHASPR